MKDFRTYGQNVTAVKHSHAGQAAFARRVVDDRHNPGWRLVGGTPHGLSAWCWAEANRAAADGDLINADKLAAIAKKAG